MFFMQSEQQLNDIFQALSDATRRSILMRLQMKEQRVSDIVLHYDMSMPAVTKHLNILEKAGLITRRKEGRERFCQAEPKHLKTAMQWLIHYEKFWDGQLQNLKDFVEHQKDTKT